MGSQMTWRLSPFVGDPAQPFVLIQPSRDNFYVDVLNASFRATGVQSSRFEINTLMIGAACLIPLITLLFAIGLIMDKRTRPAPRTS